MPFLEKVTSGRNIPKERLLEVAEHYYHFGGKSPINEQNLALLAAIASELESRGYDLPTYWGNRNWHPFFEDTLKEMVGQGHQKVIALFTSAYSSYSGCRQYRENLDKARQEVGPSSPTVEKLRVFFNHPGFLEPMAEGLRTGLKRFDQERVAVLFAAHSIPNSMAVGCKYERQLHEASLLCAGLAGLREDQWIEAAEPLAGRLCTTELVYQSRSGPPQVPWLEPDICDQIRLRVSQGAQAIIVVPIGFVSDHMEVLYDLDTEAKELCEELTVGWHRVPSVGTDPRFISMIVDLIEERSGLREEKVFLGSLGPSHDVCPKDCCLSGSTGHPGRPSAP